MNIASKCKTRTMYCQLQLLILVEGLVTILAVATTNSKHNVHIVSVLAW